ncbi:transposase [Ruegeria sp. PrR005]|uniref:Transposase n=1 Tax=Ruegeria sp. PrR005 TaxID=2706882 RepID=A0A6B2NY92_9RHOB|nr:transposase [Ruegeria sp. PrR005]NDW47713.1 transposase [Ruegeria sp. PrR005]
MACYIRPRMPGATVFFTVALAKSGGSLLVNRVDVLREAVRQTQRARPFVIDAWVVLPDHLHAVWTLPDGDADFSTRWGAIKARFSRGVGSTGGSMVGLKPTLQGAGRVGFKPTDVAEMRRARSASKVAKADAGIWQRRFWEHHIRDTADYEAHMRYCWLNPVKHGLAERPVDWPYSSIHRDIRKGRIEADWSGPIPEGRFGENA